jgi:hypothetical protein
MGCLSLFREINHSLKKQIGDQIFMFLAIDQFFNFSKAVEEQSIGC